MNSGIVKYGDLIVIIVGIVGEFGIMNLMKVYIVGDIIVKG